MKRTVRCLVLLALGAGVWACRGNPVDLERGTATGLKADPSAIFMDQGSTVGVIVEAKDELNQAVAMSDISSSASAGVTIQRDMEYNRVYNEAGELVLPENPTRARFIVTASTATQTSVTVNANGLSLTLPVRVVPVAILPPLSTTTPGYGDNVTMTLQDDIVIDPDVVADPAEWQGLVTFPNLPDAFVTDVQSQSITFQVPPNVNGPATLRRIVMPYAPAVDSLNLETAEDIVSPVLDTVDVTVADLTPQGLDIVTITLNDPELRFGAASEFGLEGTDGNCSLDAICTKMVVESRAVDGSSAVVFMPPDVTGQLWVSDIEPINATNYPTDVRGDANVAVGPSTFTVTVSTLPAPSGLGLEITRITAGPGYSFSSTASVVSGGEGVEALPVGVDPAGNFIDYIPTADATGVPRIAGVVPDAAPAFEFELDANLEVDGPDGGDALPGTDGTATAPTLPLPGPGNSSTIYDAGSFGALEILGTEQIYSITVGATTTLSLSLDWPDHDADVDFAVVDEAITAILCGDTGRTGAAPEEITCTDLAPGNYWVVAQLFGGAPPTVLGITLTEAP